MKKLIVLAVLLSLLLISVGTALAAPWNNPNGYWIYDVACEDGTYDVFVANNDTRASFKDVGNVGVMKALYILTSDGYMMLWSVPGKGVSNHTTYCTWEMEIDGVLMSMAGDVLIP